MSIPLDLTALKALAAKADLLSKKVEAAVSAHNSKAELELMNIGARVSNIIDPKRREEAHAIYMQEHAEWLKDHRKATEADRWEPLKELNSLREAAFQSKELLGNPVVVATAYGLGSPERSGIANEIAGLGPMALLNLSRRAELAQDRNLTAALVCANDRLPRSDRPFQSQALAEKVFGAECKAVAEIVRNVDALTAKSVALNRAAEGRPLSGTEKISAALTHGNAINPDKRPTLTAKAKSPTQKISAGLLKSADFGG